MTDQAQIHSAQCTSQLGEPGSRRLSDRASRGVDDSLTRRVGESLSEFFLQTFRLGESGRVAMVSQGVAIRNFLNLSSIFRTLNGWTSPLEDQFNIGPLLSFKGLKKIVSIGNLVDSPTRRVGESFFDYKYLREIEAKIGTAWNVLNRFLQKRQKIRIIAMSLYKRYYFHERNYSQL